VGFAEKRMKEEEKGISVIFEELLRKRQKNEQYIHKTFVKHHLNLDPISNCDFH
jgi:hypothetical protein